MRTSKMLRNRWVIAALGAVTGLVLAGSASANSISLVWTAINGGTIAPTSSVNLSPNDTATLDIIVTPTSGVTFVNVDISFGASFTAVPLTAAECPVPPNPAFGCLSGATLLTPANAGVNPGAGSSGPGTYGAFEALTPSFNATTVPFTLGRIDLMAVGGSGVVGMVYGIQGGYNDGTGTVLSNAGNPNGIPLNGASFSIIPEPATAALMVLGLGALAWTGRRR